MLYLSENTLGSRQHGSNQSPFCVALARDGCAAAFGVKFISSGDPNRFYGRPGRRKTFPFKGQVVRVSGSNFTMTRKMVGSGHALHVTFTLTADTIYVGGSQDGLVPGAKARVSFHFDASNSNIAYADKVRFLSGR
jgi:hypothetical protein